jgi:hypothetical protein
MITKTADTLTGISGLYCAENRNRDELRRRVWIQQRS